MPNSITKIVQKIRENIWWLIACFFASIFIFAGIYNLIWYFDTGAFVINEEMNEQPFQYVNFMSLNEWDDQIFLEHIEKYPLNRTFLTLDKITPQISQLSNELIEIDSQQNDTETQLTHLHDDFKNASNGYWEGCWSNYYIALDTELEPLKNKRDGLNRTLQILENNALKTEKLNIELNISELDYEIALTKVKFLNNTNTNSYCDPVKSRELAKISNNENQLFALRANLSNAYSDKRNSLFELLKNARESRVNKLNYVDFLYFSTTTATTTALGDIMPNNSCVRLVVILQTILSIVIVGLFLDDLSSKIRSVK